MMANIIKMLHPFIPFFTEHLWAKNNYKTIFKDHLISSSWPKYKTLNKFNKNQIDVNNIIQFISSIRSTKAELKITPKLFCEVSFNEKKPKLNKLINNNLNLVKPVGRISNITVNQENNKKILLTYWF